MQEQDLYHRNLVMINSRAVVDARPNLNLNLKRLSARIQPNTEFNSENITLNQYFGMSETIHLNTNDNQLENTNIKLKSNSIGIQVQRSQRLPLNKLPQPRLPLNRYLDPVVLSPNLLRTIRIKLHAALQNLNTKTWLWK